MSNIIKNGFTTTMDDCINAATVAEALTAQNKYIEEHAVQGPQGEPGPQGNPGKDGTDGPANVLSIGSVTKGENAEVSITGEAPAQVLNFVLPKGDRGPQGDPGPQGEPGRDGISFNYMGSWTENNDYHVNDVVKSDGDLYICILDIAESVIKPTQDATHWSLFLSGGGTTLKWKTVTPQGSAYILDGEKAVAFKSNIRFTFNYNDKTYNCNLATLNILGKYKSLDAILGGEGIGFASSGSEIIPVYIDVGLKHAEGTGVEQYYIKLFSVIANLFGTFADVTEACNIPISPAENGIEVLTYE